MSWTDIRNLSHTIWPMIKTERVGWHFEQKQWSKSRLHCYHSIIMCTARAKKKSLSKNDYYVPQCSIFIFMKIIQFIRAHADKMKFMANEILCSTFYRSLFYFFKKSGFVYICIKIAWYFHFELDVYKPHTMLFQSKLPSLIFRFVHDYSSSIFFKM